VTRRVSSGAPWEPVVGYSRAVAAGDHVWAWALEQVGASLDDVVRTRIFVTDISRWEEYGRAHGVAFGPTMPATSMVEVRALIDPRMLVEVEAVAYCPGVGG
jgi:Endoribonuclease L-PSP